jgi:hypothetical protein
MRTQLGWRAAFLMVTLWSVLSGKNAVGQSFPPGQVTHLVRQALPAAQEGPAPANLSLAPAGTSACTETSKSGTTTFTYPSWFPLWWNGCHDDNQIQNFFAENGMVDAGRAAKYEYNAQQSASVVNADLLTATFQPGLQVVLAGSATSGSGNSNSNSTASGSTSTSSDSVATAVTKLENGGDFNLRIPLPLLSWTKGALTTVGQFTPNVGFTINGLSAQNTITDSTQYSLNLPVEFYGQLTSTKGSTTPAVLFLDVKPAGEFFSKTLAAKLGPSVPTALFLGEASAGIEFSQKVRVSLQYVYGNASVYQSGSSSTTTSGTSGSSQTQRIGGFHLAVSFSK